MTKTLIALTIFMGASFAQADVCAWNNNSVASRARNFLAYYPGKVYEFCKPCNDSHLKSIYYGQDKPSNMSADTKDNRAIRNEDRPSFGGETSYHQIVLNPRLDEGLNWDERLAKRELDLAYAYIQDPEWPKAYINIGAMFGCAPKDFFAAPPSERTSDYDLEVEDDQGRIALQPAHLHIGNFKENGINPHDLVRADVTHSDFEQAFGVRFQSAAPNQADGDEDIELPDLEYVD